MAAEAVESAGWLAPGGAWLVVGALAAAGLFNALYAGKRYATDGEGTAATELISGALEKERVKGEWKEYDAFFTQNGTGDGVPAASDKSKAPGFVDKVRVGVGVGARACAARQVRVFGCCVGGKDALVRVFVCVCVRSQTLTVRARACVCACVRVHESSTTW